MCPLPLHTQFLLQFQVNHIKRSIVSLHHISITIWPERGEVKEDRRTPSVMVKHEMIHTCSSISVSFLVTDVSWGRKGPALLLRFGLYIKVGFWKTESDQIP